MLPYSSYAVAHASVAQLDRASVFGTEGWGFESLRAYFDFVLLSAKRCAVGSGSLFEKAPPRMATTIAQPSPAPVPSQPAPTAERSGSIRTQPSERLLSLDAYRGFIMVVLASGGLGLYEVARKSFPDNPTWQTLGYHFHHVRWVGCALWDLIQPSFMFMVGVAMAYSCASPTGPWSVVLPRMLLHAVMRSVVLVLLGIFLRSGSGTQTNFTFMDVRVADRTGLHVLVPAMGHAALCAGHRGGRDPGRLLVFFAVYPLPPSRFRLRVGRRVGRLAAPGRLSPHWDKNTNPAANFDVWFLNLLPRTKPFAYEGSGYPTLNFIPSLATMIFGLMAGEFLAGRYRNGRSS